MNSDKAQRQDAQSGAAAAREKRLKDQLKANLARRKSGKAAAKSPENADSQDKG